MGKLFYTKLIVSFFGVFFLIFDGINAAGLKAKNVTEINRNTTNYFFRIYSSFENILLDIDFCKYDGVANNNYKNKLFDEVSAGEEAVFMCQIQTQLSQTACIDNGGGIYTANFDLIVNWSGAPASEDIQISVGSANIATIDLITATSPQTISFSLDADGIGQDTIIAFFETTTTCADTFIIKSPVPCPPNIGACTNTGSISLGIPSIAQEATGGAVAFNSEIDLIETIGGATQTIGIHYSNVNIPNGATITSASIQFETFSILNTNPIALTIKGDDSDNAAAFMATPFDITVRTRTTDSVDWSPANWSIANEMAANQLTPDLSAIVQEIVNRPGWNANQNLAFIINGSGRRVASGEAILNIEYQYIGDCGTENGCASVAGDEIAGTAWKDHNCDGILNEAELLGIQGVQVTLFDCVGALVGTTHTNASGNYKFTGLSNQKYRIEFTLPENIACWAKPTHAGTDNGTMIQFVLPGNCASLGLSNPADFCEANPLIGMTCFSEGIYNGSTTGDPAIISLPYDAEGHHFSGTTKLPAYQGTILDSIGGLGSAYGLAWQATRQRMYLGAYHKRYSGFGSGGPDAIYQYDLAGNQTGILELDALLSGTNTAGIDVHDFVTTNNGDVMDLGTGDASFDGVGKRSLGDLEMSSDMTTLYVVNLFDRKVYSINVADGIPANASIIDSWDTPDPLGLGTHRPFALKWHKGKLWVGIVTEDAANAYVYALDVQNGSFNLELTIPLGYDRQSVVGSNANATAVEGDWRAWTSMASTTNYVADGDDIAYPQPMLTDIEFDGEAMILGFRDRFGDQAGSEAYFNDADATADRLTWSATAGDILRACYNGYSYVLETGNGGACSGTSGLDDSGPGGQEYYHWDYYYFNSDWNPLRVGGGFHWETTQGALLQLANDPFVVTTAMDPYSDYSGGILRLNNETGRREGILANDKVDANDLIGGYTIYESGEYGSDPPPNTNGTFGKANGLGDLEAFCGAAPLEIGNYVWCDSIQNGLQDGCESGVAGLIVQLYDITGRLIGQDSTTNEGHYYFNQDNVDTTGISTGEIGIATPMTGWSGLDYNTPYFIVFGDGQFNSDEFKLGSLKYKVGDLVDVNGNGDNLIDSDIHPDSITIGSIGSRPDGLPFLAITTDNNGCGDHQYDLGLTCCNLQMNYTQVNCMDNGDGTFTADYDLEVNWIGIPNGGDLEVVVNNLIIQTINTSTSISPDTITFSLPADGNGKDSIIVRAASVSSCADTLVFKSPVACPNDIATCSNGTGCLGGNAFEDFSCNGIDDTHEPGVQGVQVVLYDCQNNAIDTVWTDSDGDWQVCSLTDGDAYRVEFILPENIACWANPTHAGSDNGTDVQFLTAPACTKFSLSNPNDYCEENPYLTTACYTNGDMTTDGGAFEPGFYYALVANQYDNTGKSGDVGYVAADHLATGGNIGVVWGLAYDNSEDKIYAASFLKRHTGFPSRDSLGKIWVTTDPLGTPSSSSFVDLIALGEDIGQSLLPVTRSLAQSTGNPSQDSVVFHLIGKVGLGDLEISDDNQFLYVVNLYKKEVLEIAINTATITNRYPIPDLNCTDGETRPFALKYHKGILYTGAVCTAENGGSAADLSAAVFALNGNSFNKVTEVALDYNRSIINGSSLAANWLPWTNTWQTIGGGNEILYPQPILSDIEIDVDGSLILGFTDRVGHQTGINNYDLTGNGTFSGVVAGDIIRICKINGAYVMEGTGACSYNVSPLQNGSSGGEFYSGENFDSHHETAIGGLALLPGKGEVATTGYDPYDYTTGGIFYLDNTTGADSNRYEVFGSGDPGNFGKAAGLGDLEALCAPAPLEIGNYVWCDSLQNGIQDACERGIDNLLVQLYKEDGTLVGQDTTTNGNYFFNQYNVDTTGISIDGSGMASPNMAWTGMNYSARYYIVFGAGQFSSGEFTVGSDIYNGITIANVNSNENDNIDSDVDGNNLTSGSLGARPDGLPFINMVTTATGCGDHQFDMGVICVPPCEIVIQFSQTTCTDNGNGTFTSNNDLVVFWSNITENLEVVVNNTVIQTINTGTSISPDTIPFSVAADAIDKDSVIVRAVTSLSCADTLVFKSPLACPNDVATCATSTGCIGGNAFEDFNCNGTSDTYEPGVQGIQVVIYDCQNNAVDTAWTDSDGDWQICGLTDGEAYRVEFILPENIACWATPTHVGTDNGSDVQFLTAPACTKFSINNPTDYCQTNPPLSVVCYLQPLDTAAVAWKDSAAIVQIPYESGTTDMTVAGLSSVENAAYMNTIATNGEVGSVFGLATDNKNSIMYTTAFMKRHIPFGPSGPGAIYKMQGGSVSTFMDLNTLLIGNPAGVDGHSPSGNNYQLDNIWDVVGKNSFGDLLITPDGKYLYTVTLTDSDRKLYRIAIPVDGSNPTASDIERFDLPSPADCPSHPSTGSGELNYNIRPGALHYEQGRIYVGLTCTAESTQDVDDLKGYVYAFEPVGNSFSGPLLTVPFNYNRQDVTTAPSVLPGNFYPWNANQLTTSTTPAVDGDHINASYPMPWLMNINFSDDGCIILGITDRFGHLASGAHNPPAQLNGNAGGDILKACNLLGTWTLENNANDGLNPPTAGASTNAGPNSGEFFHGEHFETFHNEISNGGFAILPGLNELVLGVYDPAPVNGTLPNGFNAFDSGGMIYLNTSNGSRTRSYMLFNRNDYGGNNGLGFDKASATGGIVMNCEPAPLEIGNYVWCDSIPNGIQDACEKGIDSMVIQLYKEDGTLVGRDTTINGNYYFNQYNVDTTGLNPDGSPASGDWTGLNYEAKYYLIYGVDQYENNAFYLGDSIYNGLTMANVNGNGNDNIDSDIDSMNLSFALGDMPAGYPVLCINTDEIGCGNHQYDVGLLCSVKPLECPCPTTYSICWDNSGFNEPPNDNLSNFPWIDTMENIVGSGVDMEITLFQPARDGGSDTDPQQSYVSPGSRCGCTFDAEFAPYLSCGEVFRNWSDNDDIPDTIIISFSEPIKLPEWGFGGFRVSGAAVGTQVAIASFTFYDGPNATGNKVVSALPNPGGRAQINTGDPLTAAINEFQDQGPQETELHNGTYYYEGQNNSRGWTMLDMGDAVVHSIMWTQFIAGANLSPKDYVSLTPLSLSNSGYIASLDIEKCNCGGYDYGDLPDIADGTTGVTDYETYDSTGGPSHQIITGLFLGDTVDVEIDGFPDSQALGDDNDNVDDEDGVTFFSSLDILPGGLIKLPLSVTNTTGDTAYVEAWIDWNGDGDFDEPNEMVADLKDNEDGVFPTHLTINVPNNAINDTAIGFRIRLSNEDNMTPYGRISSGEIEDYLLTITCSTSTCLPVEIQINKEE